MRKSKEKGSKLKQIIPIIFSMGIGAVCGMVIAEYAFSKNSLKEMMFSIGVLFLSMYAAMFLQLIFHEAGHMIFGMCTGYRFSSFRVGSLMLVKTKDGMKVKRLTLAGTGGQCLMIPPEMKDGKIPYALYNMGGSLMNLLITIVCAVLFLNCSSESMWRVFFLMMIIVGIFYALMNGIPLRLGTVDNDGYNAFSLGKTPEALRSFWLQMKMNALSAAGVRMKDMPKEWFEMPSDEAMKNSMTAVIGVFVCQRMMDEMRFEEADQEMERLLSMETKIVGLYRNLMINEQIYCELVGERNEERILKLRDKSQQKFMKTMKKFPTVLRTEYVYALLLERDKEKAEKIMEKFEKVAKSYPNPIEIEGERELIAYAKKCAGNQEIIL